MGQVIDLTDQRFDRLVAKRIVGKRRKGENLWECVCDCGNVHVVPTGQLRGGNAKSCGCISGRNEPKPTRNIPARPPKQAVAVVDGRPIERLAPADRERVRANVAGFIAYAMRKNIKRELAYVHPIEEFPA